LAPFGPVVPISPVGPRAPTGPVAPVGPVTPVVLITTTEPAAFFAYKIASAVLTAISPIVIFPAVGVTADVVLYGILILIAIFYLFHIII
jgi:hypothetical protein